MYILIDVAKVLLGPLSTILCLKMVASSAAEELMAEGIGGPGGWTLVANEAFLDINWINWFIMFIWVCLKMVSTPKNPMVLLIIIPTKWLFHWGYTLFSDKPICQCYQNISVFQSWTQLPHDHLQVPVPEALPLMATAICAKVQVGQWRCDVSSTSK